MIASSIRRDILAYAERIRFTNLFMVRAAEGKLPYEAVARYLASLRFMLSRTPDHLERSRSIAEARGAEKLAAYFAQKLVEEVGHDAWAMADIAVFSRESKLSTQTSHPVPSIFALAAYLEELIEEDPRLYVTYILWAEFITALLGTELVNHLVGRCGVSENALTAVTNHVDLDEGHAEDGLLELDDLVDDPALLPAMRTSMASFARIFDQACIEMVDLSPRPLPS